MSFFHFIPYVILPLAAGPAFAGKNTARAVPCGGAPNPSAASVEMVAWADDIYWDRDSCTSVRVGDREFWTCRDSQHGETGGPFVFRSSTASWSDFSSDGTTPLIQSNTGVDIDWTPLQQNNILVQYGDVNGSSHFNPQWTNTEDDGRWEIWPDCSPLAVNTSDGGMSLYTWIKNVFSKDPPGVPSVTLYRTDYDPTETDRNVVPAAIVVPGNAPCDATGAVGGSCFYGPNSIPYGNGGGVNINGYAYLYGALTNKDSATLSYHLALARVALGSIENIEDYEYYVPTTSSWSSTPPASDDMTAAIPWAGTGGQGTFYWSDYFNSVMWVGGGYIGGNSSILVTRAPNPWGPWNKPSILPGHGPVGNNKNCGAYSVVAHPGLSSEQGNGNDIYVTYTLAYQSENYTAPLYHIIWEDSE